MPDPLCTVLDVSPLLYWVFHLYTVLDVSFLYCTGCQTHRSPVLDAGLYTAQVFSPLYCTGCLISILHWMSHLYTVPGVSSLLP